MERTKNCLMIWLMPKISGKKENLPNCKKVNIYGNSALGINMISRGGSHTVRGSTRRKPD